MKKTKIILDQYIETYLNTKERELIFYSYQSGVYKIYEMDDALTQLIYILKDSPISIDNGYKIIKKNFPDITFLEFKEVLHTLFEDNIIRVQQEFDQNVTESRWNRQDEFFNQFPQTISNVKNLANKKVAIIGIGGTGSWVAQAVAMMGVGLLKIIDDDVVELTNLNRQPLFRESDVGKRKTAVTSQFLKNINPNLQIVEINKKIYNHSDLSFLNEVDLVVSCADYPSTKEVGIIISDYCYPRGIPAIIGGGYNTHIGSIGITIVPQKSPCFRCYIAQANKNTQDIEKDYQLIFEAKSTRNYGSLAAIAGLIGNYIALDIMKILTGFSEPSSEGKFIEYNFVKNKWKEQLIIADKNCKICGGDKHG